MFSYFVSHQVPYQYQIDRDGNTFFAVIEGTVKVCIFRPTIETTHGEPTPAVNIQFDKSQVAVRGPKPINITLSSKVPEKMLEHKGIVLTKGDVFCFFDQCVASNDSYKVSCVSNTPGLNASILGISLSSLTQLQTVPKFSKFYNFISTK